MSEIPNVEEFEDASAKEQMAELAGAVGEGMAIKFAEHRKVVAYLTQLRYLMVRLFKLDKKVSVRYRKI